MIQAATKIDPQVAETIEQAFALNRQKQTDWSIEIMKTLAVKSPNIWHVQFCLALFLYRDGRFNESIKHGYLAVQLSPKSAKASMILYQALGKAGLLVESLEEMKRYLSMKPTGKYAEILRGLKRDIEEDLERNPDADSDCGR
jgi:tetratricopeptide (TPR) repeat protein